MLHPIFEEILRPYTKGMIDPFPKAKTKNPHETVTYQNPVDNPVDNLLITQEFTVPKVIVGIPKKISDRTKGHS